MIGTSFAAGPAVPTTGSRPGWNWHRLTDLAQLATGHTPSRRQPDYWGGGIPWLQLPDIRALDGRTATDTSEHINHLGIQNSAAVLLPAGTVCMSRTASVGFVTIMGRPMATSQDFVNWICGPSLDPIFLMYLLVANRNGIRELGSGAVHQTIYFPTVESFSVCIPALDEQRRIASILAEQLDEANRARVAAESRVRAADALAPAYLRDAFAGDQFPVRELQSVCRTITDGTHLPPPFTDSGIPFLFVRNIVSGQINFQVEKFISEDTYETLTKRHRPERGDVLFSAVGSFGIAAVVETDAKFAFQRHIAHIKTRVEDLDPTFLTFFLNSASGRSQSAAVAMGGAQKTVTLAELRKFQVPLPAFDEQLRVVLELKQRLAGSDRVVNLCREELKAIEAMPASLLRSSLGQ